eukprot:2015995-Rhodomonas_salina.2
MDYTRSHDEVEEYKGVAAGGGNDNGQSVEALNPHMDDPINSATSKSSKSSISATMQSNLRAVTLSVQQNLRL